MFSVAVLIVSCIMLAVTLIVHKRILDNLGESKKIKSAILEQVTVCKDILKTAATHGKLGDQQRVILSDQLGEVRGIMETGLTAAETAAKIAAKTAVSTGRKVDVIIEKMNGDSNDGIGNPAPKS